MHFADLISILEYGINLSNLEFIQGTNDQSPSRQHKAIVKNRPVGNQANNGAVSKQDGLSNGVGQSMQPDFTHNKTEVKRYGQDREKVIVIFCSIYALS